MFVRFHHDFTENMIKKELFKIDRADRFEDDYVIMHVPVNKIHEYFYEEWKLLSIFFAHYESRFRVFNVFYNPLFQKLSQSYYPPCSKNGQEFNFMLNKKRWYKSRVGFLARHSNNCFCSWLFFRFLGAIRFFISFLSESDRIYSSHIPTYSF